MLQNMQTKVNELMATKPIMSEFDAIFRHYTVPLPPSTISYCQIFYCHNILYSVEIQAIDRRNEYR